MMDDFRQGWKNASLCEKLLLPFWLVVFCGLLYLDFFVFLMGKIGKKMMNK